MSLESRSDVPVSVEALVRQIEALDEKTKQELFRQLERAEIAAESSPELPKPRLSDFWGVGAELWSDENVDDYIRKERDSWD